MKQRWSLVVFLVGPLLLLAGVAANEVLAQRPTDDAPATVPTREPGLDIQIVGGQNADPGEYPWQVRVLPGSFLCGGSLIDENWVLTAAHCVYENGGAMSSDQVTVVLGDHDKNSTDGPNDAEQIKGIDRVVVHESYDPNTLDNDIALLELSSPASLSDRIQTISLNQSNLSTGLLATVTGWGTLSAGGDTPDILQEVSVPIVSQQSCNTAYGGGITGNMICAGYDEGGKDSCQGDSGGPLVVPDGSGGFRQAGIVSWGIGCASAEYPGVYTKVANYVTWISDKIGEELSTPTPTPTATPPPDGQELIQDGGFELDQGAWTEYSSNGWPLIVSGGAFAHAGDNYVWLGGGNNEYGKLSQGVTIPADSSATLEFYYYIQSEDSCGFDSAAVLVDFTPVKSYDLCQSNNTGGWARETIDLTGQQGFVYIEFEIDTDVIKVSNFYLDDVSLKVTSNPSPTPTGTPSPAALLNGDFEAGPNGDWQETSSNGFGLIYSKSFLPDSLNFDPHDGSYLAWLGGVNSETSVLSQTVTVPATDATLRFYYQIRSADYCGYDAADVLVGSASVLAAPYDLCGQAATSDWTLETVDLSSFAGQEVTLNFETRTDGSEVSSFFLDSVSLEGDNEPTPTPTATPTGPPPPITLKAVSGEKSVKLAWSVTNDPEITGYRIQRRAGGGNQISPPFATVATTTHTHYFDEDDDAGNDLTAGQEYCYQIEAETGDGSVVAASNISCVDFGKMALALRFANLVAAEGSQVVVPLKLAGANGLRIGAGSSLWIDYDSTVISATDIASTSLSAAYSWAESDTPVAGKANTRRLKIDVTGTDPPPIYGDGALFWLHFNVVGSAGTKTNLTLYRELLPGDSYTGTLIYHLAAGDSLQETILAPAGGSVQIESSPAAYIFGDVNGDGNVTTEDGLVALQIAAGQTQPTALQLAAGDINGDGAVQAADAGMIFYYAANADWPPVTPSVQAGGQPQPITLGLDDINGAANQTVQTTIQATSLTDFAGGDFIIVYDTNVVDSILDVQKTGLASSFEAISFHDSGEGQLRISMANPATVGGDGSLAVITLKLGSDLDLARAQETNVSRLYFADAHLYDANGLDLVNNFPPDSQPVELESATLSADYTIFRSFLPAILKQ